MSYPRSPTSYNAFDTITEPGRRSHPMFLRRKKPRRSKIIILVLTLCSILILWGWRSSGIDITPSMARMSSLTANITNPFISQSPADMSNVFPHVQDPDKAEAGRKNLEMARNHKSFHLLIPASESTPDFCKTILSAFVMGYPAPTLINWGLKSKDGAMFLESESHTAKIRGVYDFLKDKKKAKDEDMVMVVDGYDVWFQLPPQILLQRFNDLTEDANVKLKNRYGMMSEDQNGDSLAERVPRYVQKVLFGADKICWPNPKEDPACAAVPYSTLPKDVYGSNTDQDPESFNTRPRWLNSGNIIGKVKDVRAIYAEALRLVEDGKGALGDQFIFAKIFGEQEFVRETKRRQAQGTGERWLDYLSDALGTSASPLSANITINNVTVVPNQQYEYGIGLDYRSVLFQTMTHSEKDIDFIYYNTSTDLLSKHHSLPLYLPKDLQSAASPFSYASPGNHTIESNPDRKTLLLPYSPNLDDLPDHNTNEDATTWRSMPLATNTYTSAIPALLHINGDKDLLKSWWPKLWFHPFGRALLRRFIRSTQTPEAYTAAAAGGQGWWDMRGGRGGVWTDRKTWMSWDDVCHGEEESLFADGKGGFGKEEGDGRRVNEFGNVIIEGSGDA